MPGILVPQRCGINSVAQLKGRTVFISSVRGSISEYRAWRQVISRSRFSPARSGRWASKSLFGGFAKRALYAAMKEGALALASASVLMPRSRSAFVRHSRSFSHASVGPKSA